MQYVLSRYRIKPGMTEQTLAFLRDVNKNHQAEITHVLHHAGMTLDCSFVEETEHGDFVFIFKRLENLASLREQIKQMEGNIYSKIREWAQACLEEGVDLDALAVFDSIAR